MIRQPYKIGLKQLLDGVPITEHLETKPPLPKNLFQFIIQQEDIYNGKAEAKKRKSTERRRNAARRKKEIQAKDQTI